MRSNVLPLHEQQQLTGEFVEFDSPFTAQTNHQPFWKLRPSLLEFSGV